MESLEDRIAAAGKHGELVKALARFDKRKRSRDAQHELYEKLTSLGADAAEADEYINLAMEA